MNSPLNNPQYKHSANAAEYAAKGRTLIKGLMSPIMAANTTGEIQKIIKQIGAPLLAAPRVGTKPAYEVYGYKWWPMATYHFGLTPLMETLTGTALTPTYAFFRSYQAGDICRIHADRAACEHSLSLTLGYADDAPWGLSVEDSPLSEGQFFKAGQDENYGDNAYTDFPMQAGDAVLYKGIEHRHGRLAPNPNRWSAHMFLHWISTDGPYTSESYDGLTLPGSTEFNFPG